MRYGKNNEDQKSVLRNVIIQSGTLFPLCAFIYFLIRSCVGSFDLEILKHIDASTYDNSFESDTKEKGI